MIPQERFKEEVDSWIKELKSNVSEFEEWTKKIEELENNVQHNYELIYELKDLMEEVKQELNVLKIVVMLLSKKKISIK